jgi:hypothetical protein
MESITITPVSSESPLGWPDADVEVDISELLVEAGVVGRVSEIPGASAIFRVDQDCLFAKTAFRSRQR